MVVGRNGEGIEEETGGFPVIGYALDWFVGSWTEDQAREFDELVADFDAIDDELWR